MPKTNEVREFLIMAVRHDISLKDIIDEHIDSAGIIGVGLITLREQLVAIVDQHIQRRPEATEPATLQGQLISWSNLHHASCEVCAKRADWTVLIEEDDPPFESQRLVGYCDAHLPEQVRSVIASCQLHAQTPLGG